MPDLDLIGQDLAPFGIRIDIVTVVYLTLSIISSDIITLRFKLSIRS